MNGLGRISPYSPYSLALYLILALVFGIFVAMAPVVVVAGTILGTAGVVLALIRIEFGLAFLALSVPFGSIIPLGSDASGLSATEPLVALVALAWAAKVVASRNDKLRLNPIFVALIAFICVLILGMSTALSVSLSLKELLKWSGLLVVFVVAANGLKTRKQLAIVLMAVIGAGVLEALVGWYQFFGRVGPEGFLIGDRFMRAYGTFGQPNPFAGYLALVLPLTYAILLDLDWLKTKPVLSLAVILGSAGIMAGAIVMSLSRGAWLGLACAFIVMTSLRNRKLFGALLVLALIVVVLASFGAAAMLPAEITQRFADVGDYFGIFDVREVTVTQENWAIVERMASWQAAWNMSLDNVWLGLGPGNFAAYYLDYALPGWEETGGGHAHNYYLNQLAETGVVGLTVYLIWIATAFIWVLRRFRQTVRTGSRPFSLLAAPAFSLPISLRVLALGTVGIMVALHVHNIFDNLYVHSVSMHVGLVLGMVVAASSFKDQ